MRDSLKVISPIYSINYNWCRELGTTFRISFQWQNIISPHIRRCPSFCGLTAVQCCPECALLHTSLSPLLLLIMHALFSHSMFKYQWMPFFLLGQIQWHTSVLCAFSCQISFCLTVICNKAKKIMGYWWKSSISTAILPTSVSTVAA